MQGLIQPPMAWGEVFTAMQHGVIDGQENPIAVYYTSKLWDARQKNLSLLHKKQGTHAQNYVQRFENLQSGKPTHF